MTDINLKDFDKNNWDEFVHLRALQDVINQENVINNEQNQQITQNTNDVTTAKQEAEDAKNTANEAKTTADGLSDKVDTAQSTAEDAKNTADEAKTSADNAGKVAGMAQNTATQLGTQVTQLDSEVIKKGTQQITSITNVNISGSDNSKLTGNMKGKIIPIVDAQGNNYPLYECSFNLQVQDSLQNVFVDDNLNLTLSNPVPDYWDDHQLKAYMMVTDAKTNLVNLSIGIKFSDTTHCNIWMMNFGDKVLSSLSWANDTSTNYHIYVYVTDIC